MNTKKASIGLKEIYIKGSLRGRESLYKNGNQDNVIHMKLSLNKAKFSNTES